MSNFFIILILYLFSFLYSENSEKKDIPKLDLRNFNGSINNIGIGGTLDNILPDRSKDKDVFDKKLDRTLNKLLETNFKQQQLNFFT